MNDDITTSPPIGAGGGGPQGSTGSSASLGAHGRLGGEEGLPDKAERKLEEGKVQAKRLGEKARRRAVEVADSKKGAWASQLGQVAEALEEVSHTFEQRGVPAQRWVGRAAETVRRFSTEIEGRPAEELLQRAEGSFRERPGVYLAGFFVIGFFGARLLRS